MVNSATIKGSVGINLLEQMDLKVVSRGKL